MDGNGAGDPEIGSVTVPMTSFRATAIGATAVLMWGALALFTTWTGAVPPFQLIAMSFTVAFALALVKWLVRGEDLRAHFRHGAPVWLLGVGGLFGYHFFYFVALRNAPAVDASLINYLWPLLIVVFSAALPGERLRWGPNRIDCLQNRPDTSLTCFLVGKGGFADAIQGDMYFGRSGSVCGGVS